MSLDVNEMLRPVTFNHISETITDSYTPPAPSTLGIDPDQRFTYSQFPRLNHKLAGVVRPCKMLVTDTEAIRATGDGVLLGGLQTSTFKKKPLDINILLFDARVKNRRVLNTIIQVQSLHRMRVHWIKYKALRYAVSQIKKVFIRKKRRFSRARYFTTKYLAIIQSLIRMHLIRKTFLRFRASVVYFQAAMRQKIVRRWFVTIKNASILIQTMVRRVLTFQKHQALRKRLIDELRRQVFHTWSALHIPLIYRSYFWDKFSGYRLFDLTALKFELLNLLHRMGFKDISSIYSATFRGKLKDLPKGTSNPSAIITLPMVAEYSKKEQEERKHIYASLKRIQTKSKDSIDIYFLPFDLLNSKKRKQKLSSSLLWSSWETAHASSEIITNLLGNDFTYQQSGVEMFRTKMMAAVMGDVSISCFKALCEQISTKMKSEEY